MSANFSDLWLVVEDGSDEFLLLRRACLALQPSPTLYHAVDGEEGRRYLAGEGQFADRRFFPLPALIISDLKMPRLDGHELLAWIKARAALASIPFIVLTSSARQEDHDRALALGADRYLKKPEDYDALVALLKMAVSLSSS